MALRATRRKNVVHRGDRRIRLQDVPSTSIEREYWDAGVDSVVGIDEVGRGSLAGPVTVGACILPPGRRINKVRDSKLLDDGRRRELDVRIRDFAIAWGVGHASSDDVDALGMNGALRIATLRALEQVEETAQVEVILLDGHWDYLRDSRVRTVVHGDSISLTIAAASIVAKVARDDLMIGFADNYPEYGFEGHKGYSAETHLAALERLGPTPIHRKSFGPVAAALGKTPSEVREELRGQLSFGA